MEIERNTSVNLGRVECAMHTDQASVGTWQRGMQVCEKYVTHLKVYFGHLFM